MSRPSRLLIRLAALSAVVLGGAFAVSGGASFGAKASERRVVRPAPAPGPLDNPLKGWCTYTEAGTIHQPYSMVFRYVSWKELEPAEGDYRFADWEAKTWEEPAAQGKHVVLRVYVDYPGRPSGLPDWLKKKGVKTTRYTDYGGGLSPDYNHPAMVTGLERLLAAMGKRYDMNPRVAFVQMGLLGFWGEWHTYPRNELFASPATQKRILDASRRAFPNKIVMTRYPGNYAGTLPWIGFFDDMFPEDTDGPEEWKFLPVMRASGRTENWKQAAIGGEMVPNAAKKWLGPEFDWTVRMLERAHFTWVGPYNPALEPEQTEAFVSRSQQLVRRMGYEYRLKELQHQATVVSGKTLEITLRGENQGVAPFYYPWPVEVALLDNEGREIAILPLSADIRRWLPGPFTLTDAPAVTAPPGHYRLALGIRDPWTNRPAIGFANDLPRQNGWTLVSEVMVTAP
jgi:hypothetical protein